MSTHCKASSHNAQRWMNLNKAFWDVYWIAVCINNACTFKQLGCVIWAQLEHSMSSSPVSWLPSPQISHTAESGRPGYCEKTESQSDINQYMQTKEGYIVSKMHNVKTLTARHWRSTQVCLSLPGPPNFFMSLQKLQSPHSVRWHASQRLQRTRRRRRTDILEAGFMGRGVMGVVASLGRITGGGGGGGWYQGGLGEEQREIRGKCCSVVGLGEIFK